ncbi:MULTISPECIES: dihydroorotase [unclassified Roseitalea]|uniref:dihydroorotase n=1 Tax=unclassified Roseitalea TaxID=2639107 RepID=UPI00273D31E8|nr:MULTISPECIES: dihydroorotase [unclassified Roseitalea]
MPMTDDAVYENARIVDPARNLDARGSLVVREGAIVAAGPEARNQGVPEGAARIDCAGLTVMPGLVDLRVHIGEPGGEHRETIRSACAAAAAGGVTSLVMMPDTDPVIDDVALVEFVARTVREIDTVRVHPAAAITKGLAGAEMTEMGNLREAGAVMFTEGRQTVRDAAVMRRAMTYARDLGAPIAHHTVEADLAGNGVMNEGLLASWLGLPGIAREAELLPLERDLRLARLTGATYHAAKISCAMSAEAMRRAKAAGLAVTAGVSINNLALNENDIGEYRTFFKLSPPLRHEDDRLAMVEALRNGTVDAICSDHDPQDVDTKRLPFAEAEDGAVGLETLLSAALRLFHSGDVPLMRLVDALTHRPARIAGLEAGTLMPGRPADFIVVDLDEPFVLDPADLKSKSKNTAFDGARLTGRVRRTVVAGRTVFGA